jgi:hypothetical protein
MLALVAIVLSACALMPEKSPEDMCREMFDKQWGLAEGMLSEIARAGQAAAPVAVLNFMRDVARGGYIEQCRRTVTRDDYECVMKSQSLGELLGKRCRIPIESRNEPPAP